ncbi:MAG: hypothetical protein Tsb002_21160 [Wenzhouxiangellaceae bacterium]
MATYLHPGVYIEEVPSSARPIEGVSTSVTAFVGAAYRGPVGSAQLVGKLDDYLRDYGPIVSEDDAMGLAVQSFYLNGGGAAYICRLAGAGTTTASFGIAGQGPAGGAPTAQNALLIEASSAGEWGNGVYVQVVKPDTDALHFNLIVGHHEDGELVVDEVHANLTLKSGDANHALARVNGVSSRIHLTLGPAAEVGGANEAYQGATLTGGALPTTADYFSSRIAGPMTLTLTLNLNGMGARQITINPVLAGNNANDATAIRDAILAAVQGLSTQAAYQNFTINFAANRYTLGSPEDEDQASIEVYGGDLATILRLDNTQTATLTSAAVGAAADLFSDPAAGIPSLANTDLTLNIDQYGDRTISLDVAALGLSGDNALDGGRVATAIQNAVRALDSAIPSYKDFTCTYTAARQFVLRSGSSNVRRSGLAVTDGPLADLLGLNAADNPTPLLGRQVVQGNAQVIPLNNLGPMGQGVVLAGGQDNAPTPQDYSTFYNNTLRKVRDVSIIVLPGQQWAADGSGNAAISNTLAHCESTGSRVLIIDPPAATELEQAAQVDQMALPTSTYSVLYYPWVQVANPLYNVDTNPTASRTLDIPPAGMLAGQWARTDARRGVWKAPAGVGVQLNAVAGLRYNVEDLEQDQLNPLGVNCIRKMPGYGSVVWGARTLATKADPPWRYVPVRRTAIFIEQSIYNGIQWAVFEPNDHPLWGSLRANIGAFMNGLFRAGAFQGATADEAYFVRCGLGDTMTQADIDRGQVIVIVGFAPLKPAEFVIVRIQQKVGQE